MNIRRSVLVSVCSAVFVAGLAVTGTPTTTPPALAAGSDPCEKYRKGTKKWKKCKGYSFAPGNPSTDEEIYQAGYWLAKNGRFGEAITMLQRVENQDDPRVLNYLGFAKRKSGRVEEGLTYYRRALGINPDFVLAREYMGEALLQKGDVSAAREQLNEIGKRCGTSCPSYVKLAGLMSDNVD